MSDCRKCDKYKTCTKLCKEAEKYVSQDHVARTERTFSELGVDVERVIDDIQGDTFISSTDPKYLIYKMYFVDKVSVLTIKDHVEFSRQHIHRIINKLRESINSYTNTKTRKILTLHFLQLKNPKEIAKEIDVSTRYAHKSIADHINKTLHTL